ncbi:putative ABC transport system permease protein [Inhella inkyongensis]|uniref:Putative ABC transport system permease protein n=1 Tax=Inhella inkyongensis TaxID=392593 RepID=A0A840SC16_9BURK|nr:FtsX-like permease family protein [Inhella inkyongensis]MBB5205879.1 putative ABC transport system permease protein [Inhella inkyongensis]
MNPSPASSSVSLSRLAAQRLWRDARAGELRLLVIGMSLAVAAVCAVALLVNRLEQGLARDAAQLIGGDVVLASDQPASAPWRAEVDEAGWKSAESSSFASMARADDAQGGASRLVAVKAVPPNYPLRGRVMLSDGRAVGAPAAGQVWVDQAVLDALELAVGDRLWLGEAQLRVGGVIATEPDRGAGFLAFAPRLMLASADLPATGLVQPGSRIGYRLAVVAEAHQQPALREWRERMRERLARGEWRGARIESLESGRPELRQTLDRGLIFLRLVALLAALLAAVGVALAARDFAQRHLDESAMLRVLGLASWRIACIYGLELLAVGVLAGLLGLALGGGVQALLIGLLQGLLPVDLPLPNWQPWALAFGLGMSLLLAFGLPPVLNLARIAPLRVLRRDLGARQSALALGVGVLGLALWLGLLALSAGDAQLAGVTLGGFVAAAFLLAALAWALLWGLRRAIRAPGLPAWLRLATRQVAARPGLAVVQVVALGLGLLALAVLILLRTDLLESWRLATPTRGPDRFVINIQPEQAPDLLAALAEAGVKPLDWYPMFRGRLVAINEQPIPQRKFDNERAQRLVEREFNLSQAVQMPSHNRSVSGQWGGGLSVEAGLARDLGLALGDRLAFEVAGERHVAPITQVRSVEWSSMRVNFFVMFARESVDGLPHTWIATLRAPVDPAAARRLDKRLAAQFPNITVVDVSAQLAQVQRVLEQVADAVQLLFGLTLAVGVVVLLGALTASREARLRDVALMRALGASARLLARVQRAELLGLGALAGVLAAGLALGLGALLALKVFGFAWQPRPWVPLGVVLGGAALAWGAGYWGLRGVLLRAPLLSLRNASGD